MNLKSGLKTFYVSFSAFVVLVSCTNVRKVQDLFATSEEGTPKAAIENSLESVVTSFSGAADEAMAESYASVPKTEGIRVAFEKFLGTPAWAASVPCKRTAAAPCIGGTFTQDGTYSGCSLGKTEFTLTGGVRLLWKRVGCTLLEENDQVARTMNFTRTGPAGGQLQVTSGEHTAWDGTKIGGGQVLTKNATDFSVETKGVHKVLTTAGGKTLYDHSLKTTENIHLSSLPRVTLNDDLTSVLAARSITSGTLDLYHNILKYKATYKVTAALGYDKDCCYPTSGKLTATLSGSLTGSATVDFQTSCGTAVVTYDDQSTTIVLALCE